MKWVRMVVMFLTIAVGANLMMSCNNNAVTSEDIDKIKLEIVEMRPHLVGLSYTIRLSNQSRQVIKQNKVYLSYPIKTESGSKGNEFKIEAKNNKLNIKPGEELILTVFAPKEMYEGNRYIDVDNPTLEIEGYINKVTEPSHFGKSGGHHHR